MRESVPKTASYSICYFLKLTHTSNLVFSLADVVLMIIEFSHLIHATLLTFTVCYLSNACIDTFTPTYSYLLYES